MEKRMSTSPEAILFFFPERLDSSLYQTGCSIVNDDRACLRIALPAHLLKRFTILENVLEWNVKLAHVVLAKAVLVPAHGFEKQAVDS